MAFEDYDKVADPLILPIAGKKYRIPEVGMKDGIKFNLDAEATLKVQEEIAAAEKAGDEEAAAAAAAKMPAQMGDTDFLRMFLGSAYDEMLADNVPGGSVLRAAITAMTDFQKGRPMAEIMWATGGDPKAIERYLKPNRATRRSTSSGGAKKTPSQASTSGTTTASSR
ncbi:MAG TPA: hypothetical protein VN108_11755 [Marmoricola sp.]|nr:hypothetical protein [Marmoricola sp.]